MNCSKVRRFASAYLDAELPAEHRAAVRRHVRQCDDCGSLLAEYRELSAVTATWTNDDPPASLWRSLAPQLQAACAAVALDAELPPAPSVAASSRHTFKPMLEGLEDRQALSGWLSAAGAAISAIAAPVTAAVATLRFEGGWRTQQESLADAADDEMWSGMTVVLGHAMA